MDYDVQGICDSLLSGETPRIRAAIRDLEKILHAHYAEREREGEATQALRLLRDKFIEKSHSEKPAERYAGIRGIGAMQNSNVFDEKIQEMIALFIKTIADESGKVRFASANAFGHMRPMEIMGFSGKFTGQMYAELYVALEKMHKAEKDRKKKKSLMQAMELLSCPSLVDCLRKNGYAMAIKKGFY